MIGIFAAIFIISGVVYAIFTGNINSVSDIILSSSKDTVEFCLKIGGTICFFCGIMKIAQKAGITECLAKSLRPIISKIIPSSINNKQAEENICMNVSSNILGLGNAATPFGIKAAKSLFVGITDRSLASFVILNTSSIQLIPSTIAAIRQAAGSASPFEIILPVIISQFSACVAGLIFVRLLFKK